MLSPFLTFLLAFKFLFYFFFLIFIEVIIFGSIRFLSKKNNQTEIKKKNETGSNRPVSVRLFQDKNRFKPVWLGFSGLTRFFSGLGSVRFGFSVSGL
jgi:energy-converting hydrogenase Eha subunit H